MDSDSERTQLIDVTGGTAMPAPLPHPTEGATAGTVGAVVTFPVYLHEGRLVVYFPEGEEARNELVDRILAAAQEVAEETFMPLVPPRPAPARARR